MRKNFNMHQHKEDFKSEMDEEEFKKHLKKIRMIHFMMSKRGAKFHKRHDELHRYFKYAKLLRPIGLMIFLAVLYMLLSWAGVKIIGIIIAALISIKEVFEFFFMLHMEKRIMRPIDKLKSGVDEITKGNYDVKVECEVKNDIGELVDSFNFMAQKLLENERIKSEYEENRKLLIANISHDLKTPITSIQGYIEAILDGTVVKQESINKYLETINRNTAYINKLIDDLFLFSKLDMQKLDFNFERVQVLPFMNDLMEEFKFELVDKQFKFDYSEKMESDCFINIDRKRIHQAIRNIISNAIKYGPEKDLKIDAEIFSLEDFVCVNIKDNGPGIPEDKLSHIFKRFYRIDTERTKDLMSTGLGLSIAKELIEAHNGKIEVTSIENEGTCFKIMLPMDNQL